MNVLTYTDTRARLKEVMDHVTRDKAPVVITRQSGEAVVMVSLSDWNAIEETTYLLTAPTNAKRLLAAVAELEAGQGVEHDLADLRSGS